MGTGAVKIQNDNKSNDLCPKIKMAIYSPSWHYKPVRLSSLEHKKKTSEECYIVEVNGDWVDIQAPKKPYKSIKKEVHMTYTILGLHIYLRNRLKYQTFCSENLALKSYAAIRLSTNNDFVIMISVCSSHKAIIWDRSKTNKQPGFLSGIHFVFRRREKVNVI